MDVTFYKDGHWKMNNNLTYPKSATSIAGDIMSMLGIDTDARSWVQNIEQTTINGALNMLRNFVRQRGVEMRWKQRRSGDDVKLLLNLDSDSYEKFSDIYAVLGNVHLSELEEGIFHLQIDHRGVNTEFLNEVGINNLLPFSNLFGMSDDYKLVIITGKVISSNADKVVGGTATWFNPSSVDIIFEPRSNFSFTLLLLLIVIVVFVGLISKIKQIKNRKMSNELFSEHYINDGFF